MIAILVPTIGRPVKFKAMLQSLNDTTKELITVYALIQTEEDEKSYDVANIPLNSNIKLKALHNLERMDVPTVHMWNRLALLAQEDGCKLYMLGSDDTVFITDGWDRALLNAYGQLEKRAHVFSLKDSRLYDNGAALSTPHPIVTAEYLDAMGYFLPPLFLHWFVDTWTVEIARHNRAFSHLSDYVLVHDKAEPEHGLDETFTRLRKRGWHQRDRYVHETCQHILANEKHKLGLYL